MSDFVIMSVNDAKESGASLSPVEDFDETNPELTTFDGDARIAVEPDPTTDVAASGISVEDEGESVDQLVSSLPLADLPRPAKTQAMLAELSLGVRSLTSSEKWKTYLNTQSKFHAYSFNNALLIALQRPNATRVAGYGKWKELEHQVRKGEHGIVILAPIARTKKDEGGDKEKDKKFIAGFTTVSVFDVSQTDGPDLPEAATKLEGVAPDGQFQSLADVATSFGFTVEKVEDNVLGGANGDCDPLAKKIRVKASNSGPQQVKTLAHELGHAILHDSESDLPRGHKEIEAESVAYVVSKSLGIDSSDYSFGYLASWSKGDPDEAEKTIKASGMRIQKAAHQIIEAFEGDEPAVEVSNELGIEMQPPQLVAEVAGDVERDLTGDHSDPRVDESTEPVRLQVREVESPDERGQENSVELLARDVPTNSYRPLSGAELDVLSSFADVEPELEI